MIREQLLKKELGKTSDFRWRRRKLENQFESGAEVVGDQS
jgi:hypothetical protein